jgi:multidrug resistance efflux pump
VTALVDTDSLRIDAYFEETRLSHIHVGDRVRIRLMGVTPRLAGHVESIAGGIMDRERQPGASLLANINPTFDWVRLPQRIPVRIALDEVPAGVQVIPGRTATVDVTGTAQ